MVNNWVDPGFKRLEKTIAAGVPVMPIKREELSNSTSPDTSKFPPGVEITADLVTCFPVPVNTGISFATGFVPV